MASTDNDYVDSARAITRRHVVGEMVVFRIGAGSMNATKSTGEDYWFVLDGDGPVTAYGEGDPRTRW